MKIKLYDPHPGFGGAIVPLPKSIKVFIDSMDGEETTIEQCLDKLRKEIKNISGKVSVEDSKEYIQLRIESESGMIHSWRLIRYKEI